MDTDRIEARRPSSDRLDASVLVPTRPELERQCEIDFIRVRGPGGQNRNRRETGVRLTHTATGITVQATERRNRVRNVEMAYERMTARLASAAARPKPRIATTQPERVDARRLERKRRRSELKHTRRRVRWAPI